MCVWEAQIEKDAVNNNSIRFWNCWECECASVPHWTKQLQKDSLTVGYMKRWSNNKDTHTHASASLIFLTWFKDNRLIDQCENNHLNVAVTEISWWHCFNVQWPITWIVRWLRAANSWKKWLICLVQTDNDTLIIRHLSTDRTLAFESLPTLKQPFKYDKVLREYVAHKLALTSVAKKDFPHSWKKYRQWI